MEINEYILNQTDILYYNFQKDNTKMIILYCFSFLIIGIDLTSLFIAIKQHSIFDQLTKTYNYIIFIPIFIEWIISILFLIYYKHKLILIKKQVMKIIIGCKSNIKCSNEYNINNLSKKLQLRTKYFIHNIFEKCLILIIIFFIPIFLKVILFKKYKYKNIFSIFSIIIFVIKFLKDLIQLIIIKYKSYKQMKNNNLIYYENKYSVNNKIKEISNTIKKNSSIISEIFMNISSFIIKIFIELLCLIYVSQIGDKLDDPIKGTSWLYLFIPIFILFIPILVCLILHCISLYTILKSKIWIGIITILPFFFSFLINIFLIPMILDNRIDFSPYNIPIIFSIGILFFGIHIKIINGELKKYK